MRRRLSEPIFPFCATVFCISLRGFSPTCEPTSPTVCLPHSRLNIVPTAERPILIPAFVSSHSAKRPAHEPYLMFLSIFFPLLQAPAVTVTTAATPAAAATAPASTPAIPTPALAIPESGAGSSVSSMGVSPATTPLPVCHRGSQTPTIFCAILDAFRFWLCFSVG